MDSRAWDARYTDAELVWGAPPNRFVVEHATSLPRGRALDLACGEGRNALWLATRGWEVLGLDFSPVALQKAAQVAERSPAAVRRRLAWRVADVVTAPLDESGTGFDLVLWSYLHLPARDRTAALLSACEALRPDGLLLLVCHDTTNLTEGWGGPQDASVLLSPDDVTSVLPDGVTVLRAERVTRDVDTPDGPRVAIDALVLARRVAPDT